MEGIIWNSIELNEKCKCLNSSTCNIHRGFFRFYSWEGQKSLCTRSIRKVQKRLYDCKEPRLRQSAFPFVLLKFPNDLSTSVRTWFIKVFSNPAHTEWRAVHTSDSSSIVSLYTSPKWTCKRGYFPSLWWVLQDFNYCCFQDKSDTLDAITTEKIEN